LGLGLWGLGPNPQSPIPNPQSPIPIIIIYYNYNLNQEKILKIKPRKKINKKWVSQKKAKKRSKN
jgi:hypothetical protein